MKSVSMNEALELCRQGKDMTGEQRQDMVQKRLKELVFYAREHSPFFHELYQDIREDFELCDLPPVTKGTLMQSYERWVTDPDINYESVMAYLNSEDSIGTPYLGKYSAINTSGTTGNPMPMVRDAYHNTIHGAMIQTRLLCNVDADIMDPKTHRLASVIYMDPKVSTYSSFLKLKRANEEYSNNLLAVPLLDEMDVVYRKLDQFQPDLLTGYPSVMGAIANAQKQGKINLHLQAIACSAETLTAEMYQLLTETFGCAVLNNYCSTEGGESAMSCSCGRLHINEDWVIIEPVTKDKSPVKPGEWSDGICITDLTNYVQPIIRYYMEDNIRISHGCSCGSSFPVMEIMGRMSKNLTIGGKEMIGIGIVKKLEDVSGVYSIQLVQKGDRSFEVRIVAENEEKKQLAFADAKKRLGEYFKEMKCDPVELTLSEKAPKRSLKGGKVKLLERDF